MNDDAFSIKGTKECSKKFAAALRRKFLTRGNLLRIFFLFLEDLGRLCRQGVATQVNLKLLPALLQKLVGELFFYFSFRRDFWREILRDFFSDQQNEGSTLSGNISGIFRKKIRG